MDLATTARLEAKTNLCAEFGADFRLLGLILKNSATLTADHDRLFATLLVREARFAGMLRTV